MHREKLFNFKVSEEQYEQLRAEAKAREVSISDYVRALVLNDPESRKALGLPPLG